MFSLSSSFQHPETPTGSRNPLQFRPLNSSPLVDSPETPKSSPVAAAQARRKSQYKAHIPTTPLFSRTSIGTRGSLRRNGSAGGNALAVEADPQKAFMRDRFQARCPERATKAREKAVRKGRQDTFGGPSSDDHPMEEDSDEDDDDIMQDELFRRIVANASRKQSHSYRVSYAQEVGSSFDPDLEDISSWEAELSAVNTAESRGEQTPIASLSESPFSHLPEQNANAQGFISPADLEDLELEEYAAECERRAAMADFEDLPEEELFGWNDGIDSEPTTPSPLHRAIEDEDVMDMS